MQNARLHPDAVAPGPSGGSGGSGAPAVGVGGGGGVPGGRLNLLLSHAGWEPDPWVDAVPRLLEPMGVRSIRVASGREATRVIGSITIHVAIVDLGLPLAEDAGASVDEEAGAKLLELLRRQASAPPTVAVTRPRSTRDEQRQMSAALKAGAFAVIDRPRGPHDLNTLLEVLRRVLRRHYRDQWPGAAGLTV